MARRGTRRSREWGGVPAAEGSTIPVRYDERGETVGPHRVRARGGARRRRESVARGTLGALRRAVGGGGSYLLAVSGAPGVHRSDAADLPRRPGGSVRGKCWGLMANRQSARLLRACSLCE